MVLLLLLVTVGVIAGQVFFKVTKDRGNPGQQRGDIVLAGDVLPSQIKEWTLTGFEPAKMPDRLPEGQYWWTHSWTYESPIGLCVVAFDQADWKVWHETFLLLSGGWLGYPRADRHTRSA